MVVRWAKETSLLGWVLIHQVLEVERASAKNHLVSLGVLGCWPWSTSFFKCISSHLLRYLCGNGDVTEAPLVPQVLKGGHHVGLEVIPAKAELCSDIAVSN